MTAPDPAGHDQPYGRSPYGQEQYRQEQHGQPPYGQEQYGQPAGLARGSGPYQPVPQQGSGPIGKVRGTGTCILLTVVTLGVYSLFWYYSVHDEMKRHTGSGLGGALGLLIAFFVGIVSPFIVSSEIGGLYERRGQYPPVSGTTGLWYFPGLFLFFIGPIVWFVKTNGALNAYWRSLGAPG